DDRPVAGLLEHGHLAERCKVVDARVGTRVRREDKSILEQHADAIGQDAISSVRTMKLSRVVGPKVMMSATSAASLPLAMRIRPMRGMLLRGSNVYQPSPRYASNQAAKSIGAYGGG